MSNADLIQAEHNSHEDELCTAVLMKFSLLQLGIKDTTGQKWFVVCKIVKINMYALMMRSMITSKIYKSHLNIRMLV